MKSFITQGHKVYAIAPWDEYSDKLIAKGVIFVPLKMNPYSTSVFQNIKLTASIFRIYTKYRFGYIFHYTIKLNIFGALVANFLRIPNISVVTGLGRTFEFSQMIQPLINRLYRHANKHVAFVWFLNESDKARFISEGLVSEQKAKLLPSEGVNTQRFRGAPLTLKTKRITRFLFAGRLLKNKGLLEYVSAAKILHNKHQGLKFEIAGFINPQNENSIQLEEITAWQKEGYINYLGSREDIRPFINQADCLVHPTFYNEGISRILLEAASMSRPIITTDRPGCREVVRDDFNGYLVYDHSIEELVEKIEKFLDLEPDERRLMGLRGRKHIKKHFDEEYVIKAYKKVIHQEREQKSLST